jgi:hypothetical protein
MYRDYWSIERILILFVSLAYMRIGIQFTLYHLSSSISIMFEIAAVATVF